MPSSQLPGGGPAPSLNIRTVQPLPVFRTPVAVPPPSSPISELKMTILRILTGGAHPSPSRPMTYSEQLKDETINGWRRAMLRLELRQNEMIAPETRERAAEKDRGEREEWIGFELLDEHECSLLEEGDEIIVRLKEEHTIAELRLPDLGQHHKFAAPASSLTRAGTFTAPPPYTPAEPSSHSSSVAARPNVNYHAHSYSDYSNGYRVVTAGNGAGGVARRTGAEIGLGLPAQSRTAMGARRASASAAPNNNSSGQGAANGHAPSAAAGQLNMPLTALVIGPGVQGAVGRNVSSASAPQGSQGPGAVTALSGFTAAEVRTRPKRKPSRQKSVDALGMALTNSAPGGAQSQAQAQAMSPTLSVPSRQPSNLNSAAADAAERRAAAAAAAREAADATPPLHSKPSALDGGGKRPSRTRMPSGQSASSRPTRVELPPAPILPPIQNLAPLPVEDGAPMSPHERGLPPMPSAVGAPTVSSPNAASQLNSPPIRTSTPGSAGLEMTSPPIAPTSPYEGWASRSRSSEHSLSNPSIGSSALASPPVDAMTPTPNSASSPAPTSAAAGPAPAPAPVPASKAERRYAEIQRALARERSKQAEAETARRLEISRREERMKKQREEKEKEERDRKVKEKWEVWEEVRRREKEAGLLPPKVVDRPIPERGASGGR